MGKACSKQCLSQRWTAISDDCCLLYSNYSRVWPNEKYEKGVRIQAMACTNCVCPVCRVTYTRSCLAWIVAGAMLVHAHTDLIAFFVNNFFFLFVRILKKSKKRKLFSMDEFLFCNELVVDAWKMQWNILCCMFLCCFHYVRQCKSQQVIIQYVRATIYIFPLWKFISKTTHIYLTFYDCAFILRAHGNPSISRLDSWS